MENKILYRDKLKLSLSAIPKLYPEIEFANANPNSLDFDINFDAIVSVDKNNAIGFKNKLIVNSKADMELFKSFTIGKAIIMGRKTFESLHKKPLLYRLNIVVTSDSNYDAGEFSDYVLVINSLDKIKTAREFLDLCKEKFGFYPAIGFGRNPVIIGGATLYNQAMIDNRIDMFVIDCVDYAAPHADTFFPQNEFDRHKILYTDSWDKLAKDTGEDYDLHVTQYTFDKDVKY